MTVKSGPRICTVAVMIVLAAAPWLPTTKAQATDPHLKRKEKAIGLLNQAIVIAQSEPDPIDKAFALLLIAEPLANIGEKDRAAELLAEADRLMQPVKELGDGLSKNVIMFPLAATYVEAGRAERAEAIFDGIIHEYEEMPANPDNEWQGRAADNRAEWLVHFAPFYVILGKRQKAMEILAANYERLKKINHWLYRDRGLGRTAMAYAALGERERAVEIAETVKPGREADEAWSMITVAYAQAGDLDKAFELIQSKGSGEFFEAAYFLWIAKQNVEHGGKDKAIAVIEKLASRYGNKEAQRKGPFGEIAIGWALVGEFEKAMQTSKRAASHFDQMKTLTSLSQIFFKAGRVKEANRLAVKASKLTGFSKGSYFEARDLKDVAEVYAAIGRQEEAANLLSSALGVLAKSHDGIENMIRIDISISYARMGMDEHAVAAADAINGKSEKARALASIASVLLGIKSYDERLTPFGPFHLP